MNFKINQIIFALKTLCNNVFYQRDFLRQLSTNWSTEAPRLSYLSIYNSTDASLATSSALLKDSLFIQ